jgi:hypothetical protein
MVRPLLPQQQLYEIGPTGSTSYPQRRQTSASSGVNVGAVMIDD